MKVRLQKNDTNICFLLYLSSFCNITLNFSLTFIRIKLKYYNFESDLLVKNIVFVLKKQKNRPHLYLKEEGE